MESDNPGAGPNPETEVAVYAKMTNPSGLSEALHVEHHEQLEGPFADGGRFRCRKTTIGEDVKYVLTMKVKSRAKSLMGVKSNIEYDLPIDETFYNAFKNLSSKRLSKTRYVFHGSKTNDSNSDGQAPALPPVKYEVDVFNRPDGTPSQWVKIDIELDGVIEKLKEAGKDPSKATLSIKVSHLPIKPTGGFIADQATPEQKEMLSALWDNEFNLPVFENYS